MSLDASSSDHRHPLFAPFDNNMEPDVNSAKDDVDGTCSFQFWVDSIESFYCKLDGCGWEGRGSASTCQTQVPLTPWSLTLSSSRKTPTRPTINARLSNVLV
jgi:hypothetical protein